MDGSGGEPCGRCAAFLDELDRAAAGRRWFGSSGREPVLPGLLATLDEAMVCTRRLAAHVRQTMPGAFAWSQKTVASGGVQSISGFHPILGEASHAPPTLVRLLAHRIGHHIRMLDTHDCLDAAGWPGYYHAAHAEKQLAVMAPDEPLVVSRSMCMDCHRFFRRLAVTRGHVQIVGDPRSIRFFLGDGTVRELERPKWMAAP